MERAFRLVEMESPTRTTNKSLMRLTTEKGYSAEEVYKQLCNQQVDLVLTAHPTQALRTSLLRKVRQRMRVHAALRPAAHHLNQTIIVTTTTTKILVWLLSWQVVGVF
eukprot:364100-Chlamydomonas_euryale.AAC.75